MWLKIIIVLLSEQFMMVRSVVMMVKLKWICSLEKILMVSIMLCISVVIVFMVNCYLKCNQMYISIVVIVRMIVIIVVWINLLDIFGFMDFI